MIVFSIGLPSQFAHWCDRLTTSLLGLPGAAADSFDANNLEEVAAGLMRMRAGATRLVACSRQPSNRLQSEIVQNGHPFLVALGDPGTVVRRQLAGGADLATATQRVASSCAAMRTLTTAPNALVLTEHAETDPMAIAQAVSQHLGIAAEPHELARIVQELADAALQPEEAAGTDPAAAIDERTQAIIDGAVLPYAAYLAGAGDLEPLVWEPELFCLLEDPPAAVPVRATRSVDLTGRPRILIYGPGITLPPGEWTANVVLAFSAETAGNSFLLDINAGQPLAHVRAESTGEHIIDVALRFVVPPTLDAAIDVRLHSERAAFEGHVTLGQVTLQPVKNPEGTATEAATA